MFGKFFSWMFGTKNDREINRMHKTVLAINALAESYQDFSDQDLAEKTRIFKDRFARGETLDDLLVEAFATVREASQRALQMRHFDCQLIGGITLHNNAIAEMRTGEGKTLVATLPAYLNALSGLGVHVVTVNDYLACRDADWMRPLYEFLGLSVGVVTSQQPTDEKKAAYDADITYCTNNELGFDYLRDNMCFRIEDRVQRGHNFAIIDEVDSILVDEARTPLIISGPASDSSELYRKINKLIPDLEPQVRAEQSDREAMLAKFSEADAEQPGHFFVDEKQRQVELTESGHELVEQKLTKLGLIKAGESLYAANNLTLLHHVSAGLKAYHLFQKDVHYIVQDGQIVIVDEHTGRLMPGRRWSDGIHQAIEAKESLNIAQENQTHASTTFQNYFRQYAKLSGMTGTADTEAYEFKQIYGLNVIVIPTNKATVREDLNDVVYMSIAEKYEAIVEDVKQQVEKRRPVLVGTASIESSEALNQLLKKAGIEHQVLNAKFHQKEAEIVAQAGKPSTVTIATNMAGRGTDIVLGGSFKSDLAKEPNANEAQRKTIMEHWQARHDQVIESGGLHIISAERHESRRIDNQLRGRAGRQGDPGSTRFYLSLEDNLMRIFASDRIRTMMQSLGMEQGEAIEHPWISKSIENAQRKVEGRNFDMRKSLLEYDDVASEQRNLMYQQRDEILTLDSLDEALQELREDVALGLVSQFSPQSDLAEQWDLAGLARVLENEYRLPVNLQTLEPNIRGDRQALGEFIVLQMQLAFEEKMQVLGEPERVLQLQREVMLSIIDRLWREHLLSLEHLRRGIHLRGYAQKNPKQEYKREAFELFQVMLDQAKGDIVRTLSALEIKRVEEVDALAAARAEKANEKLNTLHPSAADVSLEEVHADPSLVSEVLPAEEGAAEQAKAEPVKAAPKVGRNQACPCGSGKKYKHCHGKITP